MEDVPELTEQNGDILLAQGMCCVWKGGMEEGGRKGRRKGGREGGRKGGREEEGKQEGGTKEGGKEEALVTAVPVCALLQGLFGLT